MEAKPIVKNKFWIVEDHGNKIATIQAAPDGVVLVKDSKREKFANFKVLSSKYNIHPSKLVKQPKALRQEHAIYGFPTSSKPFNVVYDVRRRLPFFSKTSKSKSFFCAGYYVVCINKHWQVQFCPKTITINRYDYAGPFSTKVEAETKVSCLNK